MGDKFGSVDIPAQGEQKVQDAIADGALVGLAGRNRFLYAGNSNSASWSHSAQIDN